MWYSIESVGDPVMACNCLSLFTTFEDLFIKCSNNLKNLKLPDHDLNI